MGYIYARLIHKGIRILREVPEKYKAVTISAYKEICGVDIND